MDRNPEIFVTAGEKQYKIQSTMVIQHYVINIQHKK